jgi:hypothetical protein
MASQEFCEWQAAEREAQRVLARCYGRDEAWIRECDAYIASMRLPLCYPCGESILDGYCGCDPESDEALQAALQHPDYLAARAHADELGRVATRPPDQMTTRLNMRPGAIRE